MRPPRRLRPRPSAPAALPTLPPILCLLSRSWHLSQRARFPAHPFAAGSGRGRGYGGPGEEGTGRWGWGKQGAYGPRSQERPPGDSGRARGPGRLRSAGRSRLRLCPEYQRSLGGPRAVPAAGEDGPRPLPDSHRPPPSAAHPPPGAGARGRGGQREQRIRRPNPAPRPAAPRARPRGHATPGAPRRAPPVRGPARLQARPGGTAPRGPHRPPASRPGAARLRGRAGASPGPCSPGCPGTEAAAGARSAAAFRGAGCHDCGQGGRARRLWPGSGTRGGPTVSGLRADGCAPRTAARVADSALQGPGCAPELWTKSRATARGRRRRRASPRAGCAPGRPRGGFADSARPAEGGARCQKQLPAPLAQGGGAAGGSRPQLGSWRRLHCNTPGPHGSLPRPLPGGSRQAGLQGPASGYNAKEAPAAFFLPPEWFPRRESGLALWRLGTTLGHYTQTPSPCPGMNLSQSQMDLAVPGRPRRGPKRNKASWAPSQCLSVPVSPRPPPQPALAF
ncbi:collagen alpha-2(I) chain-like [Meles meles]|uniref:collagen alpha-2(I) chain-like n=1 Tax=Meles meles TaxID=9662 RepID=UPI001E69C68E|nr:collagen alpha-2(I) chain-like [Meles meles]